MEILEKKLDAESLQKLTEPVRGALRIIKRLTSRGIKRASNDISVTMEEIIAAPLIKWVKPDSENSDLQVVQVASITMDDRAPRLICVAEPCNEGSIFIVFDGNIIPCNHSSSMTIDVLLKLFDVFGIPLPSLLIQKSHPRYSLTMLLLSFRIRRTALASPFGTARFF